MKKPQSVKKGDYLMSRPKGSKNVPKAQALPVVGGKINLGGTPAPISPAVTILPTVTPTEKKVAIGTVTREKVFAVRPGALKIHESANGNVVLKGRLIDENGVAYMTTMLMPLNPSTGKAMKVSEIDIPASFG